MKLKDLDGKIHGKNLTSYKRAMGQTSRSKGQAQLGDFLIQIYPNIPIYEEVPCVGTRLFLDFYIDSLSLAFEFDGKQHEEYNPFLHGNRSRWVQSMQRDEIKERWCAINNITLIRVKQEDLTIEKIKGLLDARSD